MNRVYYFLSICEKGNLNLKSQIAEITLDGEPIVSSRNIVYRAHNTQGHALIVKILAAEYPSTEELARFQAEYELVKELNGPGVENILGLYPWNHSKAMVLEDSGADLRSQFSNQPVGIEEFFDIAIAAALALGRIHAGRVIHKDINPSNICWKRSQQDLRIIDFGIAVRFAKESQIKAETALEGSLPYLAPEQSGRMNRSTDYRSDYYSLGITFYEILTGRLPFHAENTLDWIHQHLTREAVPAASVRPEVPQAVSDIVAKLMRKNADERYQSSFGLLHDLKLCRDAFAKGDKNPSDFRAGSCDVSEKFAFPDQLFGREAELSLLNSAYESAAGDLPSQFLVLGYTGVGKTALVKEFFKRIGGEKKVRIMEGGFEQNSKDIPFFALRQALQNLVKAVLLEPEDELQQLQKRLGDALEGQGGFLLTLAPQLQHLIGAQAASGDLSGEVARNRSIYLLLEFFKVVARRERPLVLFLDNLQWADNPSLELLKRLAEQGDQRHMLTLMAARDHELVAGAPLLSLIDDLKNKTSVQVLRLEPLPPAAVRQYLATTLASSERQVESLASLMMSKTNGNPYFLQSLLKELYEDSRIAFDMNQGGWRWNVDVIARLNISDNVIDVILKKLSRLSPATLQLIKVCASIGVKFHEEQLLAIESDFGVDEISVALQEAVEEGFLSRSEDENGGKPQLRFQHDRIQEALYAQVPEAERTRLHLCIGRQLFAAANESEREAQAADIIRHLNLAIALITSTEEKFQLADLNYRVGFKALLATAYASAATYLELARELTRDQGWKRNYRLAYQIHLRLCESLYRTGDVPRATEIFKEACKEAATAIDRAQLHLLQSIQLNFLGRLDDALDEGLTGLKTLGVKLGRNPNPLIILALYVKIKLHLKASFFNDYKAHLKPVDEAILVQMKILSSIIVIAYQMRLDNLIGAVVMLGTYYSCRHGFTKDSAGCFINYAVILINVFREFETARKLCSLADTLDQHFNCEEARPYLKFISSCFAQPVHCSYKELWQMAVEGENWAIQIGDFPYQLYNRNGILTARNFIYAIDPDTEYLEKKFPVNSDDTGPYWIYYLWCMPFHALQGLTRERTSFDSKFLSEEALYSKHASNSLGKIGFHLFKTMVGTIFEEKKLAYQHGMKALPVLKAIFGLSEQLLSVYHFLSFSQIYLELNRWQKLKTRPLMWLMHLRIASFAKKLPKNLQMVRWLMDAELARIKGDRDRAATLYDQAIKAAAKASYTGIVALFNDIAGRFYLKAQKERIASLYLKEAYFHYDQWGATEKLRHLKENYHELLGEHTVRRDPARTHVTTMKRTTTTHHTTHTTHAPATGTRSDAGGSQLDLMAVVQASEILASEVVLESLLSKLMTTAIQCSGAQNGTLILKDDDRFYVAAVLRDDHESGLLEIPFENYDNIPHSLIQLALRSAEPLVVDDISDHHELQGDAYIAKAQPQSLLCVPIVNRAKIAGVIYVEHMSVQGAFTADRVKVLSVIASQAAIFISNAKLYASLEQKVAERTQQLANKTRDIQTMLQNLTQGIFTIKLDQKIHPEYSTFLETIFERRQLAGSDAVELLFGGSNVSADKLAQVNTVLEICLGGTMMEYALNEHLLLREIMRKKLDCREQYLELDWQAIEGEGAKLDKIMVVVRDTTEVRELRREAEQQRRELSILSRLLTAGPRNVEQFLNGAHDKLEANIALLKSGRKLSKDALKLIFRNLHTVKGNARTLGFDRIAEAVHKEEEAYSKALAAGEMQSGPELVEGHLRCRDSLGIYESVYEKTLKGLSSRPEEHDCYRSFHDEVGRLLNSSGVIDFRAELARCHERYAREAGAVTLEAILVPIRNSLPGLAEELKKVNPVLQIEPCPLRFQAKTGQVMGDVMMHCIRNALDHGIERPEERLAGGKTEQGCITVASELPKERTHLVIRVYDDGRGMNLKALEDKGRSLQRLSEGADDHAIAAMAFVEGLSTKSGVSGISGRGIGMDAVKAAIEGLGGTITIEFRGPATQGRFRPFCLRLTLPMSCLAGEVGRQSAA
jgi:predicted ATPase